MPGQMARSSDSTRARIEATRKEAARLIRLAAPKLTPDETTKARIVRAANNLGWTVSRTRHMWHGDAQRIEVHEMDQLRALQRAGTEGPKNSTEERTEES